MASGLHALDRVKRADQERLRRRLVAELESLRRGVQGELRESMEAAIAEAEPARDEVDESQRVQLRDTGERLAEADARRAQLVEAALQRMDDGSYGRCLDCGQPIEPERLRLVPWAARCRDDQEAAEREARSPRAPTL